MDVPNAVLDPPGGPTQATDPRQRGPRAGPQKKVFDSFQNHFKNFSQKTGKFLIPIKYRNCYFFSVSYKVSQSGAKGGD